MAKMWKDMHISESWKMQIQTAVRCHLTFAGMATIQVTENKCFKVWRNCCRNVKGCSQCGKQFANSLKLNVELPYDPQVHFWVNIQQNWKKGLKETTAFLAALFTVVKCASDPSVHQQMNENKKCGKIKQWNIILPWKMNAILTYATWFDVEDITESQMIRSKKDIHLVTEWGCQGLREGIGFQFGMTKF
jgi:hypothetical protein